jgi:hypothetical protein
MAENKTAAEKPARPIRRFDVFAEFSRLDGLKDGMDAEEARGYGIWLAKVVAARKFGRTRPHEEGEGTSGKRREPPKRQGKWRLLGDEPQTDTLFEKEIVDRMGSGFYKDVFRPAVKKAFDTGMKYTEIRDSIRSEWKPAGETKSRTKT